MKSTFGTRLRELRELNGMTQEEVAVKVRCVRETINRYENDMVPNPNSKIVRRLAKLFKVSVDYLLDGLLKGEDENEEE